MLQVTAIALPVDHPEEALKRAVARVLRIPPSTITSCEVAKVSADARKKDDGVRLNYIVHVTHPDEAAILAKCARDSRVQLAPDTRYAFADPPKAPTATPDAERPVIVGAGPCGMFAALLLARAGRCPIILERGKMAGPRARDVTRFWREGGEVDPDSNVQFGEGGAGTFSDGKLYTGIKDREHRIRWLLTELVAHGAPEDILVKGKPHIGTDRLITVVRRLREEITELGGEYRFETRVTDLRIENGAVRGLITASGEEIAAGTVILAVGHSARDTFDMLHRHRVPMEAKPFSVGARIEHPQSLIDQSMFGPDAGHPRLGAAAYKFVHHCGKGRDTGRAAYSFCMCPGGLVVAASSEPGGVVTNGMSSYARADANANAGFMIEIRPEDYGGTEADPLAGIRFQREWERRAYQLGGEDYRAPAQRLGDFLARRPTREFGDVAPSYRPGVVPADLRDCLPDYVAEAMRTALPQIARNLRGFDLPDAVLTAVETRSSSPLRVTRDPESLQCPAIRGLYPAGEGAGYAGGIISAAADGLRVAERLLAQ